MSTRLLTGATGLVGGAIALELLDRTDDVIYGLVRAADDASAEQRLHGALIDMARGYRRSELVHQVPSRVRAIRGDITADGCGTDLARLPRVDEVWHCAASLRYEDVHRTYIDAHNVGGTRNVLDLARRAGAGTFNHVSTAYVAGSRRGRIFEAPATDLSVANNQYERSKIAAEQLVQDAASEMRVRIMRPSIVIGHSVTHSCVNWSGVYGLARAMLRFRRLTDRKLGTFLSHTRIRLLADPDIEVNIIPVDYVARNAVTIGLSSSPQSFFHLANAAAPRLGDGIEVIMELIGLREPIWVHDQDEFTALDATLDGGMKFYRSYMNYGKQFDLCNTDAACGREASFVPMARTKMTKYILRFLRGERGFDSVRAPSRVLYPAVT